MQQYYFIPPPNSDRGALKRSIIRAYNTARTLISLALKADAASDFLLYAPHHIFRTILDASSILLEVLHSIYATDLDMAVGDAAVKQALTAMRRTIVRDGDLATRSAKMMESYWGLRHTMPSVGVGMSKFPHRIGGVVTFDCLRRWKTDLEEARKASGLQGEAAREFSLPSPCLPKFLPWLVESC
jgi:transcriptional regulatory protein LEU3